VVVRCHQELKWLQSELVASRRSLFNLPIVLMGVKVRAVPRSVPDVRLALDGRLQLRPSAGQIVQAVHDYR